MVNWDSYLEPPEYAEFEKEVCETVYCDEESCADFEKEVEWEGTASVAGSSGGLTIYVDYECPTCGEVSVHQRDVNDDHFIDPDAGRDDY